MITVRAAGADDATSIAMVHVRAWRVAYPNAFPEGFLARLDAVEWAVRRRGRMENADDTTRAFVAVDETDVIVGFAEAGPYRLTDGSGAGAPETGEVYAIYVDPGNWSTGVGLALMNATVGWLADGGHIRIGLWVLDDNPRARRFYERYGFIADGATDTFVVDRGGPYETEVREVRYIFDLAVRPHAEPRRTRPGERT